MMEGLPEGWEEVLLDDLCDITVGKTPARKELANFNGNNIWVSISDIKGKYIENTKEKLSDLGVKTCNGRLIPSNTLLLSFKLSLGKVTITKKPLYTNEAIAALIPKKEFNIEYLYYFLKKYNFSIHGRKAVKGLCLNKKILSQIKVVLPPLPTQKKIADILEKAEKLQGWRAEADKLTDEFLKSTFLKMFGDPMKNPMGWDVSNLGNELTDDTQNGLYKPEIDYGNGVPILRIDSFYDGQISNIEKLKRLKCTKEEIEKFKLQIGDILINRVNSLEYLGKCGLVKFLIEDTVYESNMMRIRPKPEKLNPTFLTMYLCTQYIKNQILGCAKKAVNQASINQKDVNSFKILVPPLPLQKKFAAIVGQVEQMRQYQQESKAHIDDLFNALMQKAFKGELVA